MSLVGLSICSCIRQSILPELHQRSVTREIEGVSVEVGIN